MLSYSTKKYLNTNKAPKWLAWPQLVALVFYVVLFLTFILSGHIIMLDMTPYYRMGVLVSFLVLPLFLIRLRLKMNVMFFAYVGCVIFSALSLAYNGTSIKGWILFLRAFVYSYLTYYLADLYISSRNIGKIIQLCFLLALPQLPLAIMQQAFIYKWLPGSLSSNVGYIDYDFGTFVGDSSLSFFCNLLIVFLLFHKKSSVIIRHKWFAVFWLTATIWYVNSELGKLVSLVIWGIYIIIHLKRPRAIFTAILGVLLIVGAFYAFGIYEDIISGFEKKLKVDASISPKHTGRYLSGGHAKGAAVYYYLHSDILWLGDGPSVYSNPIDKSKVRGNFGHHLIFYSEIGLLGWLCSLVVFLCIAFDGMPRRPKDLNWIGVLVFLSICMMGFSTAVMSKADYILIASVIAKSHLMDTIIENHDRSKIA